MRGRTGLVIAVCAVLAACADRSPPRLADGRLAVFPGSLDFSQVALHASKDAQISLRNVGRGQLGLRRAWIEGQDGGIYAATFDDPTVRQVIPGGQTGMTVRFAPAVAGLAGANLVVETDSHEGRVFRLPLAGMGVDTRAIPDARTLDFGRIEVLTTKTLSLAFTNPSPLPTQVTVAPAGPDGDEFGSRDLSLAPGETQTVPVTFAPTRVGVAEASLAVTPCQGCAVETVTLSGEGLDRAIVAEPPVVDFGQVPIDRKALRYATLHNISTEPATVHAMALDPQGDPSFTAPAPALPVTLAPDERFTYEVDYSPGHMGDASSTAVFTLPSKRHPTLEVGLRAFGGAAELCVAPLINDFGRQPVGSKTAVRINVKNCGSSNAPPLTVQSLTGTYGDLDQFSIKPGQLPRTLASGEEMDLVAYYEPTRAGGATATFTLANSVYPGEVPLQLGGTADDHLPCQLAVTPVDGLDFGTVPPGSGAVLGFKLMNKGSDLCPVKNIRLTDDGGGAFGMPGGEIDGVVMWPGDWFTFAVSYRAPDASGTLTGTLRIEQHDPAQPYLDEPLIGHTQDSCLVATPRYLDYGVARPDCPPDPREVSLSNACAEPVAIQDVRIGPGTTDGEFVLTGAPAAPLTLEPGATTTVAVDYLAQTLGMSLSPLFVAADGLERPLLVPLLGESYDRDTQIDSFVQQSNDKVDVLFVLGNSTSMVEEQPRIQAALPSFVDVALSRQVDLHVAVTTTGLVPVSDACPGGAQGGEAGRLFPVDHSLARILDQTTPDLATRLQENAEVGRCATPFDPQNPGTTSKPQGLEAMRRALSTPLVDHADDPRTPQAEDGNLGFLRYDAALAVVVVSDEDDHSPDDVATYVSFVKTLKGAGQPQRAAIYAIAPNDQACATASGNGLRYQQAAQASGGEWLSICSSDYAPLLQDIANRTFGPQTAFTLSAIPGGAGDITVSVDGQATTAWTYDPAANAVIFDTAPPPGSQIQIAYRKICPA